MVVVDAVAKDEQCLIVSMNMINYCNRPKNGLAKETPAIEK